MLTVGAATVPFTMGETVTISMLAVRIVALILMTTPMRHAFGPTGTGRIDTGAMVKSSSFAALVLLLSPCPFLFPFFLSLSLCKKLFGCTPSAGAFNLLGGDVVILTTADFQARPIAGMARVTYASTIPAA